MNSVDELYRRLAKIAEKELPNIVISMALRSALQHKRISSHLCSDATTLV